MEAVITLIELNIEPEGKNVILEGLQKTSCLRDLQAALSDQAPAVELDLAKLVDVEIRAAAGLFFGLCRTVDVSCFLKTFQFCCSLLEILSSEFERRRGGVNVN
jgi:hypothetical protein